MFERIRFEWTEFEICGTDICRLCSIDGGARHSKVPSAIFSDERRKYHVIGISPGFQPNYISTMSFDESSEINEVNISLIRQISSIFTLPPRIKIVRCFDDSLHKNCPKIVCEKGGHGLVSTAGSRVIMNHFLLDVSYQQLFRQRFIIRETVRFIGNYSFIFNQIIRTVIFPSSVEGIGYLSFYNCSNLRFIHFKSNYKLKTVGLFSFCESGIETYEIPSNVNEIEESTFQYCENLKSVKFCKDPNLKTIRLCSFYKSGIKSIEIPRGVEEIKSNAFSKCKYLRSVEYRDKQKIRFGRDVFYNYPLLTVRGY